MCVSVRRCVHVSVCVSVCLRGYNNIWKSLQCIEVAQQRQNRDSFLSITCEGWVLVDFSRSGSASQGPVLFPKVSQMLLGCVTVLSAGGVPGSRVPHGQVMHLDLHFARRSFT